MNHPEYARVERTRRFEMKRKSLSKKVWIKGLIVECPMGEPLHDCPLNSLRGLPLAQVNTIVNELSETSLKTLITDHNACFNHRMKNEKYPVL